MQRALSDLAGFNRSQAAFEQNVDKPLSQGENASYQIEWTIAVWGRTRKVKWEAM
jgi:hypothetical protein